MRMVYSRLERPWFLVFCPSTSTVVEESVNCNRNCKMLFQSNGTFSVTPPMNASFLKVLIEEHKNWIKYTSLLTRIKIRENRSLEKQVSRTMFSLWHCLPRDTKSYNRCTRLEIRLFVQHLFYIEQVCLEVKHALQSIGNQFIRDIVFPFTGLFQRCWRRPVKPGRTPHENLGGGETNVILVAALAHMKECMDHFNFEARTWFANAKSADPHAIGIRNVEKEAMYMIDKNAATWTTSDASMATTARLVMCMYAIDNGFFVVYSLFMLKSLSYRLWQAPMIWPRERICAVRPSSPSLPQAVSDAIGSRSVASFFGQAHVHDRPVVRQ